MPQQLYNYLVRDTAIPHLHEAAFHQGMATFTVAKGGLMYEAALGGQKYSYEAL